MADCGEGVRKPQVAQRITFQDLSHCSLCQLRTNNPVYLPCNDALCQDCYTLSLPSGYDDDTTTFLSRNSTNMIDCPVCRRNKVANKHKHGELSSEVFRGINQDEPSPTGSLISLDSLAETRQQTCAKALGTPESVNCSICALDSPNTEIPAEKQCLDCLDLLCSACAAIHNRTRYTRDHTLASLAEIKAGNCEVERKRRYKMPCQSHPDHPMEVYCLPCGEMLCIKCKYTDHAAHLCSDLTTAAAAHRRKLEECAQVTRARVQEMQTVLLEGERKKKAAARQRSALHEQMIGRCQLIKDQLVMYAAGLSSQVTEHFQSQIEAITEESAQMKTHLSKLLRLEVLTDRLLQHDTDVELLAGKHRYQQKFTEFCTAREPTAGKDNAGLYLNTPHYNEQAVGMLFGHLCKGSPQSDMLTKVNAAQGRFANDEGRLPYISPSARIYDAELNIKYGVLDGPAVKTDFKSCLEVSRGSVEFPLRISLSTLVLGTPSLICQFKCTSKKTSVLKLATLSNSDLVVAVFGRDYNVSQLRENSRVRLRVYDLDQKRKLDIAYGASIFGLAVGRQDEIFACGGEINSRAVDVLTPAGDWLSRFETRCQPGGLSVASDGSVVVAGSREIEFYSPRGEFIKSFRDDYTEVEHNRGMESIRKEVCCRQNELYVSDANTASVRAYNHLGELLFQFGNYGGGTGRAINPRGLSVDSFGHILVADMMHNAVQVVAAGTGGLKCILLDKELPGVRDVVCYNGAYLAIGQHDGTLSVYQYLFDKDHQPKKSAEK